MELKVYSHSCKLADAILVFGVGETDIGINYENEQLTLKGDNNY